MSNWKIEDVRRQHSVITDRIQEETPDGENLAQAHMSSDELYVVIELLRHAYYENERAYRIYRDCYLEPEEDVCGS